MTGNLKEFSETMRRLTERELNAITRAPTRIEATSWLRDFAAGADNYLKTMPTTNSAGEDQGRAKGKRKAAAA